MYLARFARHNRNKTMYKQPFDSFFDISDESSTFVNNHDLTRRPLIPPSSVIASMVGVGYNAPCAVWDWAVGVKPQPDISHLPHIQKGKLMEPTAIKHFYKQYPTYSGFKAGTMFSTTVPQIAATPDQIMRKEGDPEFLYGLEVKVPYNEDNMWTEPQIKYIVQCQAQMIANPALKSVILYEWSPNKQYAWEIPRDDALQKAILKKTEEFLEKVESKERPSRSKADPKFLQLFWDLQKHIVQLLPDPASYEDMKE
jgi:hypothetical protein